MTAIPLPLGFSAHVANIGIKDDSDDFAVLASDTECAAAAVFTRSTFAGPSVTVSQRHVQDHRARAIAVVSKNANVATGATGLRNAEAVCSGVAAALDCEPTDVLVASTGVIGRQYPMDRIRAHLDSLRAPLGGTDARRVAEAMMTTDTHPKTAVAQLRSSQGTARIVGVAKGVGMIEPDMATMLAFIVTDAEVPTDELSDTFTDVVARTFNSLSVDTDTSTSDMAAVLANGRAGTVDAAAFADALQQVCAALTRQLARDGEGATKLLTVTVRGARDDDQAKRVAKSIVNSPLVKTAVHGADPNWGRVAMAIGKCSDDTDIVQEKVRIEFGDAEVYPAMPDDAALRRLEDYLSGDDVQISADLGIATGRWTVFGCDLSDGYVRINADYTT